MKLCLNFGRYDLEGETDLGISNLSIFFFFLSVMDKYFKRKSILSCDEQNISERNVREKMDENDVGDVDIGVDVGDAGGIGDVGDIDVGDVGGHWRCWKY